MVKDTGHIYDKGASTCSQKEEVTSSGDARNLSLWSVVRNNGNNAWYVNNNCNVNNNNTYNRNVGAGVSELSDNIDEFILAEYLCYSNKHDSIEAARFHYHLSQLNKLAKSVKDGTWTQGRGYVFACSYPTVREIWAACYTDRIVHHLVAPDIVRICEKVHNANGDVSHGNRIGHSADTACRQILLNMQSFPDGFVGKRDLSGFFMSIDRQKAYETTEHFLGENKYLPIIEKLITHDPTINCDIRASESEMNAIPRNKSLFHAEEGHGLPIGNFYSQLDANLYLWPVDALHLKPEWKGRIGYTRFVDDMCVVAADPETINGFFNEAEEVLISLGCRMHKKKKYMQPVSHGVSFCGRTIKPHGIYMNNRTIHAIEETIDGTPEGEDGARQIVRSINSYFGFLKHCKAFKIQDAIARRICAKWGRYVHFKNNGRQLVFYMNYPYTNKAVSKKCINLYKQIYNGIS